jgi:molybdenum cofactor cytidylyltransferase
VIWGKAFFEQLTELSGDIGGRTILAQHGNAANSLSWHDNSIHQDIDAPDDFHSSG